MLDDHEDGRLPFGVELLRTAMGQLIREQVDRIVDRYASRIVPRPPYDPDCQSWPPAEWVKQHKAAADGLRDDLGAYYSPLELSVAVSTIDPTDEIQADADLGRNLRLLVKTKRGILIEDNTDFGPAGMYVDTYVYRDCGMIIDREGLGEGDTLDVAMAMAEKEAQS